MKDDRLRVPVNEVDLIALGRAAFTFARLEWQVVWCLEKLNPGYISVLGKKTAGNIAKDLRATVASLTDTGLQTLLEPPSVEFERLVEERNGIMHGKPGTASDGSQLLFRNGNPWTNSHLENASDEFAACESNLNAAFYGALGGP